jgi:uncharacterized protein YndB with AHSA1/START domain
MNDTIDDLGTYVRHQGRPAVRFVRTYRHPIDRVWAAISRPEEMKAWFPSTVDYEPRAGAPVTFTDDPNADPMSGTVLVYEPPRRLSLTWMDDELHLTLEPLDRGSCRLTLINVLADPSAAARNASGWHVCLAELGKALDGTPSGGPHSADAEPWRELYQRYRQAGLPAGAPIPDAAG